MGIGVRFFAFGEDGALRRFPQKLADELATGEARLPEFAGRTLRVAEVILDTEGGKPVRVGYISGMLWHFDEQGSVQRSSARAAIQALETHEDLQKESAAGEGPVINISARLARRRWEEQNRWEPTPGDITRMVHAIWPKSAGRPAEPLRSVETSWKRRTPVSYEAKNALDECWSQLLKISQQLENLGDVSLKALAEQARQKKAVDDDMLAPPLWEGIAQAAELELERRKAWKSSKGRWYAVAQRTVWQRYDQRSGDLDVIEYVERDSKEAAIKSRA